MIAPAALFVLLVLFAAEAVYLWLSQLRRVRAEQAYWAVKADSPGLYDWAKELDL